MVRISKQNQEKETVMGQEIDITLRFNLAPGKVVVNEIVYRLKELRDPLMLKFFPVTHLTSERYQENIFLLS